MSVTARRDVVEELGELKGGVLVEEGWGGEEEDGEDGEWILELKYEASWVARWVLPEEGYPEIMISWRGLVE